MKTIISNVWWIGIVIIFIGAGINWYAALSSMDMQKKRKYLIGGSSLVIIGLIMLGWGLNQNK